MTKKIMYLDMDGVLVDIFKACAKKYGKESIPNIGDLLDEDPELFYEAEPIPGAIEAFNKLVEAYDVYLLTSAPWESLGSVKAKRLWVRKYLGAPAYKRIITSHHKNLMIGDYLIDDRTANGAGEFKGELIQFGTEKYPNWDTVLNYLNIN
jgi:5'(3')-deoxyribonucleotidase|tara:strand:- start:303 stop:755 length:453 start_codon:yes stop_codon:yes gene_type:complete